MNADNTLIIMLYVSILIGAIIAMGWLTYWLDVREERRLRKQLEQYCIRPFGKSYANTPGLTYNRKGGLND